MTSKEQIATLIRMVEGGRYANLLAAFDFSKHDWEREQDEFVALIVRMIATFEADLDEPLTNKRLALAAVINRGFDEFGKRARGDLVLLSCWENQSSKALFEKAFAAVDAPDRVRARAVTLAEKLALATRAAEAGAFDEIYARAYAFSLRVTYAKTHLAAYASAIAAAADEMFGGPPLLDVLTVESFNADGFGYSLMLAISESVNRFGLR